MKLYGGRIPRELCLCSCCIIIKSFLKGNKYTCKKRRCSTTANKRKFVLYRNLRFVNYCKLADDPEKQLIIQFLVYISMIK